MSGPFEWRLQDIERKANEALQIKYEMATLCSDVGHLEHTVGKFHSETDGLLAELQDQTRQLMERQKNEPDCS